MLLLLFLTQLVSVVALAPFTPGNLALVTGSAGVTKLLELNTTGFVVQSQTLPAYPGCTWGVGGDGSMSPDGFVSPSPDGSAICFTCAGIVAIVRANGNVTYTTFAGLTSGGYSVGGVGKAGYSNCATDGAGGIWLAAGQFYTGPGLLWYGQETPGGSTTPVQLMDNVTLALRGGFSRSINLVNGQLWMYVYSSYFYRISDAAGGLPRTANSAVAVAQTSGVGGGNLAFSGDQRVWLNASRWIGVFHSGNKLCTFGLQDLVSANNVTSNAWQGSTFMINVTSYPTAGGSWSCFGVGTATPGLATPGQVFITSASTLSAYNLSTGTLKVIYSVAGIKGVVAVPHAPSASPSASMAPSASSSPTSTATVSATSTLSLSPGASASTTASYTGSQTPTGSSTVAPSVTSSASAAATSTSSGTATTSSTLTASSSPSTGALAPSNSVSTSAGLVSPIAASQTLAPTSSSSASPMTPTASSANTSALGSGANLVSASSSSIPIIGGAAGGAAVLAAAAVVTVLLMRRRRRRVAAATALTSPAGPKSAGGSVTSGGISPLAAPRTAVAGSFRAPQAALATGVKDMSAYSTRNLVVAAAPSARAPVSASAPPDALSGLAQASEGLPPGWEPIFSRSKNTYYYRHKVSQETSWVKPKMSSSQTASATDAAADAAKDLPPGWTAVLSKSKGVYYWRNASTGETRWEKP